MDYRAFKAADSPSLPAAGRYRSTGATHSATIWRVNRALKRRLALAVGIAALAAGGAVAAFAATSGTPHRGHSARTGAQPGGRDLPAAAAYLGIAPQQLESELSSGKSLAQIADSTAGKSESGLVAAIIAARRAHLAAAAEKLPKSVQAEVKRTRRAHLAAAVRRYLGLSGVQIHDQLRAGRTLAQIADSVPGKSSAGLVAAIVATRQQQLSAAVSAHKLTQAQADHRSATLTKRVTRLVNTTRVRHTARGHNGR
jgi:hypothetical protein